MYKYEVSKEFFNNNISSLWVKLVRKLFYSFTLIFSCFLINNDVQTNCIFIFIAGTQVSKAIQSMSLVYRFVFFVYFSFVLVSHPDILNDNVTVYSLVFKNLTILLYKLLLLIRLVRMFMMFISGSVGLCCIGITGSIWRSLV